MTIPDLLRDLQTLLDGYGLGLTVAGFSALVLAAFSVFLLLLAALRSVGDYAVSLRPLPAFDQAGYAISEAAETGKTMHVSPGSGAVGGATTTETLAGVSAAAALTARAAAAHIPTVLTTPDPVTLPLLQAAAEEAYRRAGVAREYQPSQVRFAGGRPNAYAVTVTDALYHENVGVSLIAGLLGDEVLFIGERGRSQGAVQIMGTTQTSSLPYAITSANWAVVGEEVFAAGAYLGKRRAHLASLLVHDWLRLLVVLAIVAGVVARTLGW